MLLGEHWEQLINDATPAWLDAVEVSLTERTNKSHIGWAPAERVAFWARVHDSEEPYTFYQDLLGNNFLHNHFQLITGAVRFSKRMAIMVLRRVSLKCCCRVRTMSCLH